MERAQDMKTHRKGEIQITNEKGGVLGGSRGSGEVPDSLTDKQQLLGRLSQREIERMLQDAEQHKALSFQGVHICVAATCSHVQDEDDLARGEIMAREAGLEMEI